MGASASPYPSSQSQVSIPQSLNQESGIRNQASGRRAPWRTHGVAVRRRPRLMHLGRLAPRALSIGRDRDRDLDLIVTHPTQPYYPNYLPALTASCASSSHPGACLCLCHGRCVRVCVCICVASASASASAPASPLGQTARLAPARLISASTATLPPRQQRGPLYEAARSHCPLSHVPSTSPRTLTAKRVRPKLLTLPQAQVSQPPVWCAVKC
jgi:hypothetical protein